MLAAVAAVLLLKVSWLERQLLLLLPRLVTLHVLRAELRMLHLLCLPLHAKLLHASPRSPYSAHRGRYKRGLGLRHLKYRWRR